MPEDERPSEKRSWYILVARYSALGLMLPAATFIGWLIGAVLDKWLHTTWLYLAGLLLGIAAGFIELVREVSKPEPK